MGKNQNKNKVSGFVNWQYYTQYLLKMNSACTISASQMIPLAVTWCQEIKR